ncbi:hypothetical protein Focb16_v009541 [Fusarium oxysporum f. sp. cubense]|uniref:Uncharacterized protein n=1 Tax=Fusarium oxysporum f. sp. cubense TaxID=61366 RepID=A0A559LWB2_FUSOC|nr:hypothetical protein Focb16_v009541 [Fusarium oxysporum f. sp. cubense]
MITPSYRNFVEYRARANPCVSRLSNYLQHECVGESKVTYLDYTNQSLEPRRIDVPEDEISQLLIMSPSVSTRFVFVENISPGLIILLGEKLDIDPLFFADYIHDAFANLEKTSPPPSLATLPSSIATRDHIHLHCQKVIDLEGTDDELKKAPYDLKTRSNVPRHVRQLVTLPGKRLALAQTCCSFIIRHIGDMNICLFLVDPPVTSVVHSLGTGLTSMYKASVSHGSFEDFRAPGPYSTFKKSPSGDT